MLDVRGVAVVTGNSSGIGFETSLTLARNGLVRSFLNIVTK
jgi:NAD(P)-dependent dehydrogenase (short-subunit alcohol dehydrogenase family)